MCLFQNFPLDLDQQQLLSGIQESIGNLYCYQAKDDASEIWYNRALDSVNELLGYVIETDEVRNLKETKGMKNTPGIHNTVILQYK